MDAGLKWFTRIWFGLVILLNIAGIVGYAIAAQSIWDLVNWVQQTYSPFNIYTHALNLVLISPAIVTYFWRKRRFKKIIYGHDPRRKNNGIVYRVAQIKKL